MRASLILFLLLTWTQPIWALLDSVQPASEQSAAITSADHKKVEKKEEAKKKPPIDPDNPGGPPANAETESLPDAASSFPLLIIIGVMLLVVAFMLRHWRRGKEPTRNI